MVQGEDTSQELLQAIRSIDKSHPPNSVAPARPDEIFHVEIQVDPKTQKEIVLWEDIVQAFEHVVQVRHKSKVVPFLKGPDFITYVYIKVSSSITMNVFFAATRKGNCKHPNVCFFISYYGQNELLVLTLAELLRCRTPFWMWL